MRKFLLIISLFILFGCQTTGRHIFNPTGYGNYFDDDWNETFYASDRLPSLKSIQWIEEKNNKFLRFTLKDKDKGGAYTDQKHRNGAPYHERAEIKQRISLNKSKIYEINFSIRFIKGFNEYGENFFQLHQSTSQCRAPPLVMLESSGGIINGLWDFKISENKGKWINFNIILDLINQRYSIKIDNKLFKELNGFRKLLAKCSTPYVKIGIYRPGSQNFSRNLSIVDFDKFQIKEIKE